MIRSDISPGEAVTAEPFVFIVAIRHPATVKDFALQQAALADLFASIDRQTDRRFAVLVACNPEQVLPPHGGKVERVHVDLAPNTGLSTAVTHEELGVLFRNDKGRRVAAALDRVAPGSYVMAVDDDDLVSRRLVEFVLAQSERCAWYVDLGYAWTSGGSVLHPMQGFHRLCGTSLVVPVEYFRYVSGRGNEYEAIQELGSHRIIVDGSAEAGQVFRPLPFRAAIYRRGHDNASQADVARIDAMTAGPPLSPVARLVEALRRFRRWVFPEKRGLMAGPRIDARRPVALDPTLRSEFFGAA